MANVLKLCKCAFIESDDKIENTEIIELGIGIDFFIVLESCSGGVQKYKCGGVAEDVWTERVFTRKGGREM